MREKRNFFKGIGERLHVPREGVPYGFSAFLMGDREVVVRGCRRILCYRADVIALAVGKRRLEIRGDALYCSSFGEHTVTVSGRIEELSFLEKVKDETYDASRVGKICSGVGD